MAHDERVYTDPFSFKPDRFMGANPKPDPRNIYYGFGRRICPGRLLADSSVFITIAMTLAVFNISKATRRFVKEIEVTYEQMPLQAIRVFHQAAVEHLIVQAAEAQ